MTTTIPNFNRTPSPLFSVEESNTVTIPFRVTVKSGESLSKITLTGTFGAAVSAPTSSFSSLKDLMENCSHAYKATFVSNASDISLIDQNAYLYFKLATTQTKLKLDIAGSTFEYGNKVVDEVDQEPFKVGSDYKELWVAVPGDATVKGNLVSQAGRTAAAGHVITIDRTYDVDLQLSNHALFKTKNEGSSTVTGAGDFYSWANACSVFGTANVPISGSTYHLPSKNDCEDLLASSVQTERTTESGVTVRYFWNDYGKITLPLAGYKSLNGSRGGNNVIADYWSGDTDPDNSIKIYRLFENKNDNSLNGMIVGLCEDNNLFTVRLVRVLP